MHPTTSSRSSRWARSRRGSTTRSSSASGASRTATRSSTAPPATRRSPSSRTGKKSSPRRTSTRTPSSSGRRARTEALQIPRASLGQLFLARPGRPADFHVLDQVLGDGGDLLDRLVEARLVALRRCARPRDLPHVLERGGLHLGFGGGRLEVE